MPRRIVQDHQRNYLFSADDPAPLGSRFWAVVKLRVIDELTGTPPRGPVTLRAQERGLTPRVSSDGLIGVVGIPQHVFPALRTQNYNVHLRVEATGYIARDMEVSIPSNPAFPSTFTPPVINLALHREPIVITGRTVQKDTNMPLASAAVSVTGIWRQALPFDAEVAPSAPLLVSLSPPLSATRAVVAERLRRRNLTPILGDDKLLLEDVLAGANSIRLSNRQSLNAGDVLLIDAGQPDLAEYIAINAITGASAASEPAYIRLNHSVVHKHRRHALVQKVALVGSQGAQNQFTDAALPGDVCVFLNTLSGLNTADQVTITGGTAPAEYHRVQRFSVTSDAAGYYRLPPLSRVAQVEIHAEATVGGTTFSTDVTFRPDYAQEENHLDLLLKS